MLEMLEMLVMVIVMMLIDLVGLQIVTGTCSHHVLGYSGTLYGVQSTVKYYQYLLCEVFLWFWGKLGLYSSDGLEICTVHSHCRMSVRTCGLDLSERILDAGIHCGKKFQYGRAFFIFLLDFCWLFFLFLFWLRLKYQRYNINWKGMDSICWDDMDYYLGRLCSTSMYICRHKNWNIRERESPEEKERKKGKKKKKNKTK